MIRKIKTKMILFLFFITGINFATAQTYPCGGVNQPTASISSVIAGCTSSSTAYTSKYRQANTFVPNTTDPLITLKVTLHIFTKDDGTVDEVNQWEDPAITPSVITSIYNTLMTVVRSPTATTDYVDRYSSPRTYTYSITSPTLATFTGTFDTRIRYEITNIYFYNSTATYFSSNPGTYITYINGIDPDRLEEGLPIIYTNDNTDPQQIAYTSLSTGLSYPAVFISPNLYDPGFMTNNLAHEIGHCFGLGHTYADGTGGGSEWGFAFQNTCNTLDYLDDVFPSPMPYCAGTGGSTVSPTPTCAACYEYGDSYFVLKSNNLMGGQYPNDWMSYKQIGRRYRNMHLTLPNKSAIRQFAKDMISDHVHTWDINSNEIWDFDIQMYQDIVVKAGNTLTIKCKVAMAIDGKIKVEKGAKLVLDGGEITGWCKTGLWKGIEVDGDNTQNQNYSGGYAIYQGIIEILNGGTLSDAQNAICTYTTNTSGVMDANSTGGVVVCTTANFINNVRSVEFYYYYSPLGGNKGFFTSCNFNTTGALRSGAAPSHHVTMYNVDGVQFKGCNFEYSAGSAYATMARGNGIYSIDAKYFVDQYSTIKTTFKNLVNGIYADNSNPLRVVSVTNTEFYDNISNSTYFNTMTTPVFTDNYVRTASAGYGACGLYLNNCKYYNVKNNTFLESSAGFANDVGIYVNNSTTGLHKIYRNSFANFLVGIDAQNNNSGTTNNTDGLKMNCNDFTPSANLYDIAVVGTSSPTVMKIQGTSSSGYTLVRNKYAAASQCSNCENKWYIESTSTRTISHPANSDANTRPTSQPQNSDVALIVTNSGIAYLAAHCPTTETEGGGGGSGRLVNINNYIGSLTIENTTAKAANSNNVSEELKTAIYSKLNYFLLDSLSSSKDSVIALLQNNPAQMEDADVLLTYAYINKGDFTMAQQNANSLNNKNDWKELQQTLISIHQHPQKAYALKSNCSAKSFLENYVLSTEKDGLGSAQSILKFATGQNYFIPHLLPYLENGINKSINSPLFGEEINLDFSVYPNPATHQVNFTYKSKDENSVHITLVSTLGKIVYEADVKANIKTIINLDNLTSGVYLLEAYKDKVQVYQTKVVCIK